MRGSHLLCKDSVHHLVHGVNWTVYKVAIGRVIKNVVVGTKREREDAAINTPRSSARLWCVSAAQPSTQETRDDAPLPPHHAR